MRPISIPMLALVALASTACGALAQTILIQTGSHPLLITPWLVALFVLLSIWLFAVGLGVRRLKRRERTWVTPVLAGRNALFARAAAPVTSVCAGFLLGVALVAFTRSWAPVMANAAWSALASAAAALVACIVAVVVERWSIDDSADDDDEGDLRGRGGGHRPTPHQAREVPPAGQNRI